MYDNGLIVEKGTKKKDTHQLSAVGVYRAENGVRVVKRVDAINYL